MKKISIILILTLVISLIASCLYSCGSLTELTFPKSLETVEYTAFSDCYALKKITFLGNTSIGGSAFDDCENVTEIIFSGTDKRPYKIESQGFSDVKIETIAFPEGLETIEPVFLNGRSVKRLRDV